MSGDPARRPHDGTTTNGDHSESTVLRRQAPPLLSKLLYASYVYGLKGILASAFWLRDWMEYRNPPEGGPNIVKTYECRPGLPVRIFFPFSYDETSPTTLPTVFTIHGGGFCIGHNRDDDEWNRVFADRHNVLVVSLNYSKAPTSPFPTAPHDIEALLLAVLADESLPIDRTTSTSTSTAPATPPSGANLSRSRTAILGFSAGGNLALSAAQLPALHAHPLRPAAAISIYGALDLSVPPHEKLANRPWKQGLLAPPRGDTRDALIALAPGFDWSYIPYGQDLRDPLLSPYYATRDRLPPFVCLIGAELDMLVHESWRMACRLSREGSGQGKGKRVVPDRESEEVSWRVCGRQGEISARKGELVVEGDERFAFEESWEAEGEGGGNGGVKWLLVPDVLHGFDNPHIRAVVGGKEASEDAELKTEAYMAELARWLKEVVWRV